MVPEIMMLPMIECHTEIMYEEVQTMIRVVVVEFMINYQLMLYLIPL